MTSIYTTDRLYQEYETICNKLDETHSKKSPCDILRVESFYFSCLDTCELFFEMNLENITYKVSDGVNILDEVARSMYEFDELSFNSQDFNDAINMCEHISITDNKN